MASITRGGGSPTQAPRRKQSHRDESWEVLDEPNGHREDVDGEIHEDEVEPPLRLTLGNLSEVLHPLRSVANRVGAEVETFAVKLDLWNKHKDEHKDERRMSGHDIHTALVKEYRKVAYEAVERLKKQHGAEVRQKKLKAWQRRTFPGNSLSGPIARKTGDIHQDATDLRSRTGPDDLQSWQLETETWDLLSILLESRYPDSETDLQQQKEDRLANVKAARIADTIRRFPQLGKNLSRLRGADRRVVEDKLWEHYATREDVWECFLSEQPLAEERYLLLRWLESTEQRSGVDLEAMVSYVEKATGRGRGLWSQSLLDTRERIKGEKRIRSMSVPLDSDAEMSTSDGSGPLITNLDPDAITRQKRQMEKADATCEASVWLVLWQLLRRGTPWKEIKEWCHDRDEVWQALSCGVQDSHSPNRFLNGGPLWRRTCFAAARNGGFDDHERAVYGLLSGDLQRVEPVCQTWDDFVYAHFNSLLLAQYDNYLESRFPDHLPSALARKFGIFDSFQFHGDSDTVGQRLVDKLKIHEKTMTEAGNPFKAIQGSLIANRFYNFLLEQGIALSNAANSGGKSSTLIPPIFDYDDSETHGKSVLFTSEDSYALRVTTHIYLVFSELGLDLGGDVERIAIENILVAYIYFLHMAGKMDMIPLYASKLSNERCELTLARLYPDVRTQPERLTQINLMFQYDINVYQVLKTQYMYALEHSEMVLKGREKFTKLDILEANDNNMWPGYRLKKDFLPHEPELHEELVVRSLEWYLLFEGHWGLTFEICADSYKMFLENGLIGGAFALSTRLPFETISLTKTGSILGRSVNILEDHEGSDDDCAPIVRRSSRLSRVEQESRSRERLKSPTKSKALRDKLKRQSRTYVELEQLVRALAALNNWRSVEDQYVTGSAKVGGASAKTQIRKALDEVSAEVEQLLHDFLTHGDDDEEKAEYRRIRNIYLPEIVLAYNSVLHCAGHLLSRDHLLQCMDLSTIVAAEDSGLMDCFVATGRMGELVTSFALSSKAILRLNEASSKSRIAKSKKKSRNGMTLGIWDIHAEA